MRIGFDDDAMTEDLLPSKRGRFEPGARLRKEWFNDLASYDYDTIPQPCLNHILIAVELGREKMGAIFIPDSYRGSKAEGQVVAVGPGKPRSKGGHHSHGISVGDRVAFKDNRGMSITVGGATCRLIKADFVLGRVV
jgi:co-chaperonin GroES (HSP10)